MRQDSLCIQCKWCTIIAYAYRMKMNAYHFLMKRKILHYPMIMASTNQPFCHRSYHYHQKKKVCTYTQSCMYAYCIHMYICTYLHMYIPVAYSGIFNFKFSIRFVKVLHFLCITWPPWNFYTSTFLLLVELDC